VTNYAEMSKHAEIVPDCGAPGTHQSMHPDLIALAYRQHDLLTLDQVRRAGFSRGAWQRAHSQAFLVRVHRGVSKLAAAPATAEQTILAAVLACDGIASHLSAARLWGAEVAGVEPVDVLVMDRASGVRPRDVRVHRPTDHRDSRPVNRQGIPTTSPLRTALDVGAVASPDVVAGILEAFVVNRYLSLATLRTARARHRRHGRTGLGVLSIVLDEWALGDKPPDSMLEAAMARLLRTHGLPSAVFHHVVRTSAGSYELDFAFTDHRLDVEVDGWAHHSSRASFEADRLRDAYLVGAGWRVLRFTWYQVSFRSEWVAGRLRDVLQR
jgi:very-short-patch-repair endonuclease